MIKLNMMDKSYEKAFIYTGVLIRNISYIFGFKSYWISDDDAYDAYDVKEYIGTEKLNNILNDVWIKSKYYKSEDGSMNFMNNYDKKIIF